jgi:uncharacterized protein with HEPN domain
MDNRSKKLLYDIYTAINNINTYIGDNRTFEFYENNAMLQDAVERNIEIIGEAVNSLLRIEPDIEITNARRIVDARNKIIHGYDEIENTQIWGIIVNHLPVLLSEVERYLKDN